MSLWSRIINVLRGDRLSREIDEELTSHIEEAIEEGRDATEARKAFGSVLRQREESRDIRLVARLDSLRADAIFGWRQLDEEKGDVRSGDSVTGARHRGLHVGLPAHRCPAVAAFTSSEPRATVCCLPSRNRA